MRYPMARRPSTIRTRAAWIAGMIAAATPTTPAHAACKNTVSRETWKTGNTPPVACRKILAAGGVNSMPSPPPAMLSVND